MDVETVRLILYDRSTGVVTLTVVDTLPLAKLESLLELRHVRLILYNRSTGVVALIAGDALPLAKLESLLELRHVFNMNRIP